MATQFSIEEFREKIVNRQLKDASCNPVNSKSRLLSKYSLLVSDYYELREQVKRVKALNPGQAIPKEYDLAFMEWRKTFLINLNGTITELDLKVQAVAESPLSYSKRHLEALQEIMIRVSGIKFLNKYKEFAPARQCLSRLKKSVQFYLIDLKIRKAQKFLHEWSYRREIAIPQTNTISILWQTTHQDNGYFQQQPVELFVRICEELSSQDLSNLMKTNGFLYNRVQNFISQKCFVIQRIASNQAEKKREACQIALPVFFHKNSDERIFTSIYIFEGLVFVGLVDCSVKILQYDWNGNFHELQTLPCNRSRAESIIATKTKLYIKTSCEIRVLTKILDGTYVAVQTIHFFSPITSFEVVKDQIFILYEGKIEIWKENSEGKFILSQVIDSNPDLERSHFQVNGELLFTGSIRGVIEVFKRAHDGKFNWLHELTSNQCQRIIYLNFSCDLLISQGDNDELHVWKQNRKGKFELTQNLRLLGYIDAMIVKGKYFFIGMHNLRRSVLTVCELNSFGKLCFIQTVKNKEGHILDMKAMGNLLFTLSNDQSVKMWKQGVDGKFFEQIQLSNSSAVVDKGNLLLENWNLFVFTSEMMGVGTLRILKLLEEGNHEMLEKEL